MERFQRAIEVGKLRILVQNHPDLRGKVLWTGWCEHCQRRIVETIEQAVARMETAQPQQFCSVPTRCEACLANVN
jgi:hypothetical protein